MSHSKPPISLPPFFLNCCDRNGAQDPKVIVYVPNQDDTFDRFARSVIDVLKDHCEHPRDCSIEFFIRRTLGDMEIDASIEDTVPFLKGGSTWPALKSAALQCFECDGAVASYYIRSISNVASIALFSLQPAPITHPPFWCCITATPKAQVFRHFT
jgi:hypothetical protein